MADARVEHEQVVEHGRQAHFSGGRSGGRRRSVKGELGRYAVPLFAVVVFCVFSILRPHTFPTIDNVRTIAETESVSLMIALGALVPMVLGYFDVSVGNVLTLAGLALVKLAGLPLGEDLLVVFLIVAAVGMLNAIVVVLFDVNSFIATIGTSTMIAGFALAVSNGAVLYQGVGAGIVGIGQTTVPGVGVSLPVVYAVVACVVLWYLLHHTQLGRSLYGIGANRDVARLSGIAVRRLSMSSFVVASCLSAFAGVMLTSQNGSADPTVGPNFLLPAFAAVFLGATTITPGFPNVGGVFFAVTLLNIITSGLGQIGAPVYVEPIFQGGILVVSVIVSRRMLAAREGRASLGGAGASAYIRRVARGGLRLSRAQDSRREQ